MYTVSIKTDFSAAHSIRGYQGDCSRLHGHNYTVEVKVNADSVDKIGMCVDFRELKKITKETIKVIDHTNLNDNPFFKENNPTAENIARFIFEEIKTRIKGKLSLDSVTVWESDDYAVTYREEGK
jgi:6-pyruvoyltetrahydropterin/6-carboxytetrahydropterin synthase